jgi:hypothetical protein
MPGPGNYAGITLYYSGDYDISHNRTTNCGNGIYVKANFQNEFGSPPYHFDGGDIYLNWFEDGAQGINYHRNPNTVDDPVLIRQNVFLRLRDIGVFPRHFDQGNTEPLFCYMLSNTFVDCGIAVRCLSDSMPNAGHQFRNNLIVRGGYVVGYVDEGGSDSYSEDRILFNRNAGYNQTSNWAIKSSTGMNLATWQAATSSDDNSSAATITFVDDGGEDFRLASNGQASLTLGRAYGGVGGADDTQIPCGAYITGSEEIGIEA